MELIRREETHHMVRRKPPRGVTPASRSQRDTIINSRITSDSVPCHYFDLICGTSTGGLIALMLGRYLMSIEDCILHYIGIVNRTFGQPRPTAMLRVGVSSQSKYRTQDMSDAIDNFLAEIDDDESLKTAPGRCAVLIPALSTMTENKFSLETLHLIRTYDNPISGSSENMQSSIPSHFGPASSFKMGEVVHAITIGPVDVSRSMTSSEGDKPKRVLLSEFPTRMSYEPCLIALHELEKLYGVKRIGTVVSIGALKKPERRSFPYHRLKLDPLRYEFPTAPRISGKELESYWRFEHAEGVDIEHNEWKPNGVRTRQNKIGKATMWKIEAAFYRWSAHYENICNLEKCAKELVAIRRLRMLDKERWKRYASENSFADPWGEESCVQDPSATVGGDEEQGESTV